MALCFVAFMLCNMDRVNMSIAILPMAKQYAWDSQTIGLVQSSFFWCAMISALVSSVSRLAREPSNSPAQPSPSHECVLGRRCALPGSSQRRHLLLAGATC